MPRSPCIDRHNVPCVWNVFDQLIRAPLMTMVAGCLYCSKLPGLERAAEASYVREKRATRLGLICTRWRLRPPWGVERTPICSGCPGHCTCTSGAIETHIDPCSPSDIVAEAPQWWWPRSLLLAVCHGLVVRCLPRRHLIAFSTRAEADLRLLMDTVNGNPSSEHPHWGYMYHTR